MHTLTTTRPRNLNIWRAAAILYGDWGTSKAYVLGLAFALAGYSSFWFILAVSILTALVGINYITICKYYPSGGGVYASVRKRSAALSMVGAFFLISDYLVTAALSALSAMHYLGVSYPTTWAICAVSAIGLLNFLGPKHSGSLAAALALPTILVVVILGVLSLPFLPQAVHQLAAPQQNILHDWNIFVGIIVALSGIEAIANTTNSMLLDPGSTPNNPCVVKTSTPAIVMVMLEVCIFTSLLGLAMNALPNLTIADGDVNAPGYPNVRDAMMRYMGETFATSLFGATVGSLFSFIISIVVSFVLLSSVNTAIVALISLLFVISRDGEVPALFQKLNSFGVPIYATLFAFIIPILLLMTFSNIASLADLYAIGFVGAIAMNLGATVTNKKLTMTTMERLLMWGTFLIMTLIEISLFVDKPHARAFVLTIMGIGLFLRMVVAEQKERAIMTPSDELILLPESSESLEGGLLVAVTGLNPSIDFAIAEAKYHQLPLQVLFLREQRVVTEEDLQRPWYADEKARQVFTYVRDAEPPSAVSFLYSITSHTSRTIAELAAGKKISRVIIGRKRTGSTLLSVLRGTTVRDVARELPKEVSLIVVY